VVFVAYIIANRAVAVFREAMELLNSHDRLAPASHASARRAGASFLLAQRQRAGVSPVMRLKTVEKCA